jgi:hypothetical protein
MISMLMDRRRLFVLNWIYSKEERRFCIYEPCHSKKASERGREREREREIQAACIVQHYYLYIMFPERRNLFPASSPSVSPPSPRRVLVPLHRTAFTNSTTKVLLVVQKRQIKNHFSSFSSSSFTTLVVVVSAMMA